MKHFFIFILTIIVVSSYSEVSCASKKSNTEKLDTLVHEIADQAASRSESRLSDAQHRIKRLEAQLATLEKTSSGTTDPQRDTVERAACFGSGFLASAIIIALLI